MTPVLTYMFVFLPHARLPYFFCQHCPGLCLVLVAEFHVLVTQSCLVVSLTLPRRQIIEGAWMGPCATGKLVIHQAKEKS